MNQNKTLFSRGSLIFTLILFESVKENYTIAKDYNFTCPYASHWFYRQSTLCNITHPEYMCLQDFNTFNNIELCSRKVEFLGKGFRSVWRGNLDGAPCSMKRYQPVIYSTSDGLDCIYQKSFCNEEGQINIHNGSSTTDTQCLCDYTTGFAFLSEPSNHCYCIPSIEDCSCYKTNCPTNYELSPDFKCVRQDGIYKKYNCSRLRYQIIRDSLEKKREMKEQTKCKVHRSEVCGFAGIKETIGTDFMKAVPEVKGGT